MKIFYLRTTLEANSPIKWKISPDFPQATVSCFSEYLKGKATEKNEDCKCLCCTIEMFKEISLNYTIFVNCTEKNCLQHKMFSTTCFNCGQIQNHSKFQRNFREKNSLQKSPQKLKNSQTKKSNQTKKQNKANHPPLNQPKKPPKPPKDPKQNYVTLYTYTHMHTYFKGSRKQPMWSIVSFFDIKSMYCVLVSYLPNCEPFCHVPNFPWRSSADETRPWITDLMKSLYVNIESKATDGLYSPAQFTFHGKVK